LTARARVATLGTGAVILTQSTGLPKAFLSKHIGPRVIGLSFEVASIITARPHLSRRPAFAPREVRSPLGRSLLLQASTSLGVFLEFHEVAANSR